MTLVSDIASMLGVSLFVTRSLSLGDNLVRLQVNGRKTTLESLLPILRFLRSSSLPCAGILLEMISAVRESSPLDEELVLDADFGWMVDPVDGTNNYALGFPICAISLAAASSRNPSLTAFSYDHSTGFLYEGGPGYGLLCGQKKLNRDAKASEVQTMIGLHFPMPGNFQSKLAPLLEKYRVRCLGQRSADSGLCCDGLLVREHRHTG